MGKVKEPRKTGITEGKFYPCPEKKVCVSTQADQNDEKHYIEPIKLETSIDEAKNKIKQVIGNMKRTKLIEEKGNYLHFLFTTSLFKFKDDVEFYIDEKENLIHFRSQSRVGGYDWNANRKRMEKFRQNFV